MRHFLRVYDKITGRDTIVGNSRQVVKALSQYIGERSIHKSANLSRSAEFIRTAFLLHGTTPTDQFFKVEGHKVANIIAELPGKKHPEKIIVIGAHYDTIAGTAGANDNASGIAALLELHRLLKPELCNRTIRFIAFVMEEPPYFGTKKMGSYIAAKASQKKGEQIELMIALDMLGVGGRFKKQSYPMEDMKLRCPKNGNFVTVVALPSNSQFAFLVKRLFNRHSFIKMFEMIAPASVPGIDHSDHSSYSKHGYPSLMVTDTGFYRNPHYHTPQDTFETLNYRFLGYTIHSLYKMVKDLANYKRLPEKR